MLLQHTRNGKIRIVEGIQKSAFSDPEYLCLLDLIHKALCAADLFMLDLIPSSPKSKKIVWIFTPGKKSMGTNVYEIKKKKNEIWLCAADLFMLDLNSSPLTFIRPENCTERQPSWHWQLWINQPHPYSGFKSMQFILWFLKSFYPVTSKSPSFCPVT